MKREQCKERKPSCQGCTLCAILIVGVTKQQLRERFLRKLRQQSGSNRRIKSLEISRSLRRLALYRRSRMLLCYVAIDGEVETRSILAGALAEGRRIAVPVIQRRHRLAATEIRNMGADLRRRGPFGIPEPKAHSRRRVDPKALDLVVVPGIAFDRSGRRLGRGKGYFDRFLSKVPPGVPRVALAFGFQVLRRLPTETHDQLVSAIVTERGVIHCR